MYELNSTTFGLHIESLVKKMHCNYIDAIVHFCEENEMDYYSVARLISPTMIEKIEMDAEELHLLKRT